MPRSIWNAIIMVFFHFLALYAIRPFISIMALNNGASNMEITLIACGYSIIQMILAVPAGILIDKKGPQLSALVGSTCLLIGLICFIFTVNWIVILLGTILIGVSHLLVQLSAQCVVTGWEGGIKETSIGMHTFVVSAGTSLGPIIGGFFYNYFNTTSTFIATGCIGGLSLLLCFLLPNNKKQYQREKMLLGFQKILYSKEIFWTIGMGGIVLFVQEATIVYYPLYASGIGLTTSKIGIIFGIRGLASMIIRPFMKAIISHYGRNISLSACLLFGGISIALYGIVHNYYIILLLFAFSGLSLGLALPLTMLLVVDIAPKEYRSQALSIRIMGNYFCQTISPIFFGFITGVFGLSIIFYLSSMLLFYFAIMQGKQAKEGIS